MGHSQCEVGFEGEVRQETQSEEWSGLSREAVVGRSCGPSLRRNVHCVWKSPLK